KDLLRLTLIRTERNLLAIDGAIPTMRQCLFPRGSESTRQTAFSVWPAVANQLLLEHVTHSLDSSVGSTRALGLRKHSQDGPVPLATLPRFAKICPQHTAGFCLESWLATASVSACRSSFELPPMPHGLGDLPSPTRGSVPSERGRVCRR